MRVERATSRTVSHLWAETRPRVVAAGSLEGAAQELVDSLALRFGESVVLARTFAGVPFARLPERVQESARGFASAAGAPAALDAATPVLSLIGSQGREPEWRDRRLSKGHAGVPLLSSTFVEGIPMIAALLRTLGASLDWVDARDAAAVARLARPGTGQLFVADAASARDARGRRLVAAQDFVARHGVASVFGFGGRYPDNRLLATVVFCRDRQQAEIADTFLPLQELFVGATAGLSEADRVFAA